MQWDVRRHVFIAVLILVSLLRAQAGSSTRTEIPFKHRAGLIWVKVSVPQSAEPLNFLLDSGAGASVINLHTAKRLNVKLGQRVDVRGVGSSAEGFWPQRLDARAGNVALPKEYLGVDLAELSRACDCCVDGLIGADFFRDRVVQIDFVEERVRLLPSSEVAGDTSRVKLRTTPKALLAAVRINDRKSQWMRVDTGCTSALQWVASDTKSAATAGGIAVGLTELNITTTATTVRLGSVTFDSVPTGLHPYPIFSGEAGLIGNGLLARFERVTFDCKKGNLVLQGHRSSL